jgi:light-regulated signal transduction histidine kinase (bacteriophytochrome)
MSRFDAELTRMRAAAVAFDQAKAMAQQYNAASTQNLRAMLAKIEKYQSKLDEDAKTAKDFITFITSLERGVTPWEKVLDRVKAMKDSDDFGPYDNKSSGALKGKLDRSKPLKPQVVAKIEAFLNGEMDRAKAISRNQIALVDKWAKHQLKHKAAVELVKKVNDSLASM